MLPNRYLIIFTTKDLIILGNFLRSVANSNLPIICLSASKNLQNLHLQKCALLLHFYVTIFSKMKIILRNIFKTISCRKNMKLLSFKICQNLHNLYKNLSRKNLPFRPKIFADFCENFICKENWKSAILRKICRVGNTEWKLCM